MHIVTLDPVCLFKSNAEHEDGFSERESRLFYTSLDRAVGRADMLGFVL